MKSSLLVTAMLFYSVHIIFVHEAHVHEWAFTHVYTPHSHTWVARGPVDLIPSLVACAWFHPPLPSLSPPLLLLSSQRQQEKAQRLPLLWAFSFTTKSLVQRPSVGRLAWPVHLYRCLWIETLSWFLFLSLHSLLHVFIVTVKILLSLSFCQWIFFVSCYSGHALLRMQLKLFIIFVGLEVKV